MPEQTLDDSPVLMYPHDEPESISGLGSSKQWLEAARIIGQNIPLARENRRAPADERQAFAYNFINGDIASAILPVKYEFGELVTEMGYQAPQTALIEAGSSVEDIEAQVQTTLHEQASYFIKPTDGFGGNGVEQYATVHEVAEAVHGQPGDYLVQSDETPLDDWRYVLHRDADDPGRVWRIAYKKVKPQVTGDGISTLATLVEQSPDIPDDRKSRIIKKIGERGQLVPGADELTWVAETGNISKGAYGKLPSDQELASVDEFMQQFTSDLEARIGTSLNTMCFDIGIKDRSVFEGPYDFEKMKQSVVFYEFQVPFGITGYLDEIYSIEGRPLDKLRSHLRRTRLVLRLGMSMLRNTIDANTVSIQP